MSVILDDDFESNAEGLPETNPAVLAANEAFEADVLGRLRLDRGATLQEVELALGIPQDDATRRPQYGRGVSARNDLRKIDVN